jgi:quinol monooxygenase YgiN
MYGLIGRMLAQPGKRAELMAILSESSSDMPGCRSYIIAEDAGHADGIWVTEVWDDAEQHRASLDLPQVKAAIARARPLIAGFDNRHETRPIGGVGL